MPEHVTLMRARALPGKLQATVDLMNRWESEQKPSARGWVRTYLVASNSDENEITAVIVWDNTQNYTANANRPGQDTWYQQLRSNLASDPEWFDAHLVKEWKA